MKDLIPVCVPGVALACLLFGCSKDTGSTGSLPPTSSSVATFDPTVSARAAAVADYQANYLGSFVSSIGWTGNSENCDPGDTPDSLKQHVVQRLNYFRRLVGLPAVSLDSSFSAKAQQAALIMKDNNALNHYPPSTWKCITPDGQLAAANSNLTLGTPGPAAIDLYIADEGVTDLGHRRWALFPALSTVGTGDTDFTNALWVIGGFGTRPAIDFSAYPGNGYIPAPLVYPTWSFSVSAADFSSASVTVSDSSGTTYAASTFLTPTGYGDNTLAWTLSSDFRTIISDVQLNVVVSGVIVNGQVRSYRYSVYIMEL
jgi:uncharacterized protein YkwD